MRLIFLLIILPHAIIGCSTTSVSPQARTMQDFETVDSLQINDVVITDTETIDHLREIYQRAKWRPYIATMPAGMMLITAKSQGNDLFYLHYRGGTLLESRDGGDVRQATLNEDDEQWMNKNFIQLAESVEDEKLQTSCVSWCLCVNISSEPGAIAEELSLAHSNR